MCTYVCIPKIHGGYNTTHIQYLPHCPCILIVYVPGIIYYCVCIYNYKILLLVLYILWPHRRNYYALVVHELCVDPLRLWFRSIWPPQLQDWPRVVSSLHPHPSIVMESVNRIVPTRKIVLFNILAYLFRDNAPNYLVGCIIQKRIYRIFGHFWV